MYDSASDIIAAKWPKCRDASEKIDRLLHDNSGKSLSIENICQFAEESSRTVYTIIHEYEKNGTLEKNECHACPEHSNVLVQPISNESPLYCDLCDRNYEIQQLKTVYIVRVKMPENVENGNTENIPVRVLISYSHDSKAHASRVLMLSDKLHEKGTDCRIDQYDPVPKQGWPVWMERQIKQTDFVICVCTEEYAKRFNFESEPGVGKGVAWEASLVRNALYIMPGANEKFFTAQFDQYNSDAIPACLQQYANFIVSNLEFDGGGYEKLYRHLTQQPETPAVKIGERVELRENRGTIALIEVRRWTSLSLKSLDSYSSPPLIWA